MQVTDADVPGLPCAISVTFHYQDLGRVVKELFGNEDFKGHFITRTGRVRKERYACKQSCA
jgi:hypothetical protein